MADVEAYNSWIIKKERVGRYIIVLTQNRKYLFRLLLRTFAPGIFYKYRVVRKWRGKKAKREALEAFDNLKENLEEKERERKGGTL